MAKRVYKPNLAFDIALCTSFSVLAAYVVYVSENPPKFTGRWQYFREGVLFWTLMLSTALVAILVPVVEYLLKIGGQWFSRTYLNDERHRTSYILFIMCRRPSVESVRSQEVH